MSYPSTTDVTQHSWPSRRGTHGSKCARADAFGACPPSAPARGDESGKEIALIFDKTSTRTRSAFEVAAYDQGARVTYLDSSGSPAAGHERGSTS